MPEHIAAVINEDLGEDPTYIDYLIYLSTFLKSPINYLEIGVSLGKSMFLVTEGIRKGIANVSDEREIMPIGFDINPLNDALKKSMKNVPFVYFQADVHNKKDWKALADACKNEDGEKLKFNLIFSDADHTELSIIHELKMLQKYDLLADEFIMYHDDLDMPGMLSTHVHLQNMMKDWYNADPIQNAKFANIHATTFDARGWVGMHEKRHQNGIISNVIRFE